jgi:hypothetical protein
MDSVIQEKQRMLKLDVLADELLDRFAVNARDYERPGNLFDSRTN